MTADKEKWFTVLSLVNEEYIEEANPLNQPAEMPAKKVKEYKAERRSISGRAIAVNAKKIVACVAAACLILAAVLVGVLVPKAGKSGSMEGSENQTPDNTVSLGIEGGFEYSAGAPLPSDFCAYKSDKNEFALDGVTLTFYYGGNFSSDIGQELEYGRNIPEFDVYFGDKNNQPVYAVAHRNENFVSEKYRCTLSYGEQPSKVSFNYSEEVAIPQSLFTAQSGVLRFCISGIDINGVDSTAQLITCIYINYDVANGRVTLSPWDGSRN